MWNMPENGARVGVAWLMQKCPAGNAIIYLEAVLSDRLARHLPQTPLRTKSVDIEL